jgi:hypothetical protein
MISWIEVNTRYFFCSADYLTYGNVDFSKHHSPSTINTEEHHSYLQIRSPMLIFEKPERNDASSVSMWCLVTMIYGRPCINFCVFPQMTWTSGLNSHSGFMQLNSNSGFMQLNINREYSNLDDQACSLEYTCGEAMPFSNRQLAIQLMNDPTERYLRFNSRS